MHSMIIAIALAGFSVAQSTISLFIPGADPYSLIAAVIGSDTTATTYAIGCADDSECDFPGGLILTEGPSTVAYTYSLGYQNSSTSALLFTGYIGCTLTGFPATAGVCTSSFSGVSAQTPGIGTSTLGLIDITYLPVTMTGFALGGTGAAASAAGSTIESASPASTTSATTASNTSVGKSTSLSMAGAAQAMSTGKVKWVAGGAAAALAML